MGKLGVGERIVVKTSPGVHIIAWEDKVQKKVEVKNSPVLVTFSLGGFAKSLIPIFGLFAEIEYSITIDE